MASVGFGKKKSPTSLKWPPIVAPCIRGLSHNDASYWSIDFRFGESQQKEVRGRILKCFALERTKNSERCLANRENDPTLWIRIEKPGSDSRMYENCWVGGREPGTAHQMTRLPHHAANFPPEKKSPLISSPTWISNPARKRIKITVPADNLWVYWNGWAFLWGAQFFPRLPTNDHEGRLSIWIGSRSVLVSINLSKRLADVTERLPTRNFWARKTICLVRWAPFARWVSGERKPEFWSLSILASQLSLCLIIGHEIDFHVCFVFRSQKQDVCNPKFPPAI